MVPILSPNFKFTSHNKNKKIYTRRKKYLHKLFFIVKLHLDLIQSKVVQSNLVLFGEFELILGLP